MTMHGSTPHAQCEISHNIILTALSQQQLIVLLFSPGTSSLHPVSNYIIQLQHFQICIWSCSLVQLLAIICITIQPHAMAPLHVYPPDISLQQHRDWYH